ncbi:MAG: hypothetical protein QW700_08375 [Desulfurococcaceae archaeon]
MPLTKGLRERVEKYTAKMVPETVGARYGASKPIAVARFSANASGIVEFRELVRTVLEANNVPAGQQGVYYAFAFKCRKALFSHEGATLKDIINGLIQDFTTGKGADPRILAKIASMVLGETV